MRNRDTQPAKAKWYDRGPKRVLDLCLALPLLLLLLPLLLLLLLLLIIFQPGTPFFCQTRVGYHCRPFRIYKFRTMTQTIASTGELLPDEQRTTWLGKILRATSLDELPELLNIVKGDMSFIGPRPWIPEQMALFSERVRQRRQSVRPGLSGLAQILGRNNLTFRQRVCLDLRYIRKQSPWLDAAVFIATFYKVIKREGIYQQADVGQSHTTPKDPTTRGLRANRTRRPHTAR